VVGDGGTTQPETTGEGDPKQLAKALGSPLAALGRLIEQWGKGGGDKP